MVYEIPRENVGYILGPGCMEIPAAIESRRFLKWTDMLSYLDGYQYVLRMVVNERIEGNKKVWGKIPEMKVNTMIMVTTWARQRGDTLLYLGFSSSISFQGTEEVCLQDILLYTTFLLGWEIATY